MKNEINMSLNVIFNINISMLCYTSLKNLSKSYVKSDKKEKRECQTIFKIDWM